MLSFLLYKISQYALIEVAVFNVDGITLKVTIQFVRATQDDIPFLLDLRKSSMTSHLLNAGIVGDDQYHLERIHEFFEDSLIICLEDTQVGLLKLSKFSQRMHIRQLQIMPDYQNKGIGQKVISAIKKQAKRLNLPITLNVLLDNPAKSLYMREGFEVFSRNDLEFQMRYQGY